MAETVLSRLECGCRISEDEDGDLHVRPCPTPQHVEMFTEVARRIAEYGIAFHEED